MLKTYFSGQRTQAYYYTGAAGPYLDAFVQWLEQSGYCHKTIRRRIGGAAQFAAWAGAAGKAIVELDGAILSAFGRYLAQHGQLRHPSGNCTARFLGAQLFLAFLATQGIVSMPVKAWTCSSLPDPLADFQHWMRTQRGVTESTLRNYQPILLDLLETLGERAEQFTAKRLREFVLDRAHRHGKGRAKTVVTAVRMFLRFLIVTGGCEPGLDQAIPTIAQWRLSSLPRYLPPETIERIIAACDTSTPLGIRDKAIILLMARLGLRAGDAAALRLSDIDWQQGTLVVTGKTRRATRLPLPQEAGDALLHYLETVRPPIGCDKVFITTCAPWLPMSRQAVGHTAARAIQRADAEAPFLGAHVFRYSAATAMPRHGVSLQAISEVLRHASIETTAYYAKVDTQLLRQVVVPWPEVTPC
jgi:integrase/recombinase XerD